MEINNSSSTCDNYLHKKCTNSEADVEPSNRNPVSMLKKKKTKPKQLKQNRNNPHIIFNI